MNALTPTNSVDEDGWLFDAAQFSPDGRQIAILGTDPQGARSLALAVNGHPKGIPLSGLAVESFAWMPDSTTLLVSERQGGFDAAMPTLQLSIWSLKGRRLRTVATGLPYDNGSNAGVTVEADGQVAVLAVRTAGPDDAPHQLVGVDLASGHTEVVASSVGGINYTHPCFALSNVLVVETGVLFTQPNGGVETIDLTSHATRKLTNSGTVAVDPTCSTRTSRVIFRVQSAGGTAGLWSVMLSGSPPVQISNDRQVIRPALYPDGNWILVLSVDPAVGFKIEPTS